MDGTAHSILHSTSLSLPYSLTLDYDTQVLYWADYALNKIERSNADGSNRRLVTTSLVYDPYSITFFNERLYWTDFSSNRILSFPTTSSSSATTTYLSASLGDMPGIQVLAKERQPEGHYFNNFLASQFSMVCMYKYVCFIDYSDKPLWFKELQSLLLIELNISSTIPMWLSR